MKETTSRETCGGPPRANSRVIAGRPSATREAASSEAAIQSAIRRALGREPDLCLWRLSQSGVTVRGGRAFRGGLSVNGAADLIGLLDSGAAPGRFFALEVKSARGRQSDMQRLWGAVVRNFGGFYAVVRSVADARAALERARNGARE